MSTTVKSVVFWVAMIVLVALVWNFSSKFQRAELPVSFIVDARGRIIWTAGPTQAADALPRAVTAVARNR